MLKGIINTSSESELREVVLSLLGEAEKMEAVQPLNYFMLHANIQPAHPQVSHVRVFITPHTNIGGEQVEDFLPGVPQTLSRPHLLMPIAVLSEFQRKWQSCEQENPYPALPRVSVYRVDCFRTSQPE